MKYLVAILIALVSGCSSPDSQPVSARAAASYTPAPKATTNVLAEPLPGKKVKISVTANDDSLYIANCNQHIVVSLLAVGSPEISWGGASDACLSQSIIIPAKATLSFVINLNDGSPELDSSVSYSARVGGVHQGLDIQSAQVPAERMTSNSFKIIP